MFLIIYVPQESTVFNLMLIYIIQTLNFKGSGETIHLEHKPSVGGIVIQRLVARFSFQFLLDQGSQIFTLVLLCL